MLFIVFSEIASFLEVSKSYQEQYRVHLIRRAGIKGKWRNKCIELGQGTCLHLQKEVI